MDTIVTCHCQLYWHDVVAVIFHNKFLASLLSKLLFLISKINSDTLDKPFISLFVVFNSSLPLFKPAYAWHHFSLCMHNSKQVNQNLIPFGLGIKSTICK